MRRGVPLPLRRFLRTAVREAPIRLGDLPADLGEAIRRPDRPLPPARLRRRVGGVSRRREFVDLGARIAEDLRHATERSKRRDPGAWLDFGCGAGRVARHVADSPFVQEFWGVDVDREAIRWAAVHLSGRYDAIPPIPPTTLPSSHFDVVYAVSIFTHFDPGSEEAWLVELHRVMKAGGLLAVTTNAPELLWQRPDASSADRERLSREGVLFLRGGGTNFNEQTVYHSTEYLMRVWGRLFGLRLWIANGAAGYQDLSVWVKW